MPRYFAFGGCLHSELHFPDLSAATSETPDWHVRVGSVVDDAIGETLLGEQSIGNGGARLFRRHDGSLRLTYQSFGSYLISADGRDIVCGADDTVRPEIQRAIVLGPAFALALHKSGTLCLHGSAVAVGNRAIAMVAPKRHGKSTLALALTAGGARLMTDDIVAIDLAPVTVARPGVHSVRLRNDSAEQLALAMGPATTLPGVKNTITCLPRRMLAWEPVRLDAIYILRPVRADLAFGTVDRTRLVAAAAIMALAIHTKLPDPLIGLRAAGVQLGWVAEVARSVPVYSLEVARAFDLLPGVAAKMLEWHGFPALTDRYAAVAGS